MRYLLGVFIRHLYLHGPHLEDGYRTEEEKKPKTTTAGILTF